jgi:hypothetical protein
MTELELKTRNLKRVYEDDIVKIFKKLPRDLDTFYDVILKNVEEDLRTELEQVLKWLLYVGRPLFVEEVVEACAITIGQKREPPSVNTYRRQASDILDNLPGLVKLDPPYLDEDGSDPPPGLHVLTFAHFSVQEYLFPMRDVQRPAGLCRFTNAFQDHQDIARSCLAYVHHCCMQTHDGTSTYPLKSYCWNFWAMHMKGIADEREAQARLTPESLHLHNSVTSSVLYDENSDIVAADWATFNQCASCFSVAAYSQIVEALQNFEFPSDGKTPKGDSPSIESPLSVASALKMEHQLQMTNSSFRALRLLILQPSSDKDASVKCNMCMDFLENHPQYSSLSYVWGNQDNPRVIYVNGQAHWILASVCSALLQLRLADRPRVLWIDSICIDQFNLEEKVSQVSFMEHIFENAQNVIAWLAENPPANSGLAMDSLNRIIRLVDEADWITLSAVGRLLQEKYWSRIWIIQELAFAQTVIVCYGTYTSSMDNWGSIDEALERLLTETGTGTIVGASIKDFRSWSAVAAVQNIRRVRNSTGGRYTLPELLYVTRSHMTYDLRDKLFGLSALLRESERNSPLLAVDYNRSLGQVCLALTVYLVQEYQCLYALSNADIESQVSWVIDLRNIKTPLVGGDPGLEIYNAGGQRSKESLPIQVETDYRTLRAYGVAVGFVSEIFGTSGLSEDVMDAELETELWRKFAKDRCKLELNDAGSALDFDRNSLLSLANWSGVFEFATSTSSSHYRPYIGMAPKRIQEGDLIVVLFGGKDAFVLREWHLAVPGPKDGNKLYKLIGEW